MTSSSAEGDAARTVRLTPVKTAVLAVVLGFGLATLSMPRGPAETAIWLFRRTPVRTDSGPPSFSSLSQALLEALQRDQGFLSKSQALAALKVFPPHHAESVLGALTLTIGGRLPGPPPEGAGPALDAWVEACRNRMSGAVDAAAAERALLRAQTHFAQVGIARTTIYGLLSAEQRAVLERDGWPPQGRVRVSSTQRLWLALHEVVGDPARR